MFLMDYFLADTLFLSCGCQVIDSKQKENTMHAILKHKEMAMKEKVLPKPALCSPVGGLIRGYLQVWQLSAD